MRFDVRAIVQTEDALDNRRKFGGNRNFASAYPVFAAVLPVALEAGAEGDFHGSNGARKVDSALRQADARNVKST